MVELKINLPETIKQAMIQVKYEEIGSWLITHGTPLFYAHKNGFTVVDTKYIDEHPDLKKALESLVEEIKKAREKRAKLAAHTINPVSTPKSQAEYIG